MAGEPITPEIVQEAGIAAHLAADPDALPAEISELSDQAAIFASQSINAFMLRGAADADSAATNFGTSLATKAVERMIEIEAERRKDDDPASDASMIADVGARQREELAKMQRISVAGIELSLEEWNQVAEVLQTDEGVDAAREALMAQGKTTDQANEIIRLTQLLASAAQKQHDGIPLTPEEAAAVARVEGDPELQEDIETATSAALNSVSQSDLTAAQSNDRNIVALADDATFQETAQEYTDASDTAELMVAARSGSSMVASTDLATSFEAGFSPAPEFNAQGLEAQIVAANEPVQSEPDQTRSQSDQDFRV